ncbi:MAG: VanZ family protein [Erysipelotrichaceae bacterium]|nr:VanZ family protein [Erysipelotrichaceae bacterium]
MEFWLNHFLSAVSYILFFIPIYILTRLGYIYFLKKTLNLKRELIMFLFIMYIIALFSQTVFISLPNDISSILKFDFKGRINTYTFQVFIDSLRNYKLGNYSYFIINVLGNVFAFVPLGIFVPILFKNKKLFSLILIGFTLSLVIEIIQLTVIRATDVDDVMLNTIGTILGYLIYRFILIKIDICEKN